MFHTLKKKKVIEHLLFICNYGGYTDKATDPYLQGAYTLSFINNHTVRLCEIK